MFSFLFSRVSFVIVFACAAVVSFIIDSHAAKAFPNVAPINSGAEPVLRSYKHFTLLSSEPGTLPGNVPETPNNQKAPNNRNAPSIIYVQSNSPRKGLLSYSLNSQHSQPQFERVTQVNKGQNLEGVKPANSFFQNANDGPNNGNSQSRLTPVLWKSPHQEKPLPQSPSQVQKVYDYQIPRSGLSAFLESRSENRFDWQSPSLPRSPVSFRRSGYWSLQSQNSKVDNGDGKAGHAGTSGIQSNKPHSFLNQKSSLLSPTSTRLDSSEIKPEKTILSISTKSSQSDIPPNGKIKTSYKRVQSYLLRNIHSTIAPKRVITQKSQYNLQGQDFNQQTKAISVRLHNEHQFGGHVGDVMTYDPASVIYRAQKKDTVTPNEDPNSGKQNVEDAKSSLADTGRSHNPYENVQPKNLNPSSGLAGWPVLKKNSLSSINSKEDHAEVRTFRFMRPSVLQKYSFGQRLLGPETTSRHFTSEFLDATTPESSSSQDYGSAKKIKIENNFKSGAVSSVELHEQNQDGKPPTKSADILRSVTMTRVKPQPKIVKHGITIAPFNRRHKQEKVKDVEFKAVTYDDIIGSASFSSVMPAKTVAYGGHFEKPETTTIQNKTMDSSDVSVDGNASINNENATMDLSVGGERVDFKGEAEAEAETETGISDLSVSKEGNEAKNVPQEVPSDPEENIEGDSLLELDYLRTSTGNVSFQSLNLNL